MLIELVEFLSLKIRKRAIKIDRRIPDSYLFDFVLSKAFMVINGFLKFRRLSVILVGKRVTVKARSLIIGGKGLLVDDGCFIDALAVRGITLGRGVSLKKNVIIECTGSLTKLGEGLSIGNNVGIGRDALFGNTSGIQNVAIGSQTLRSSTFANDNIAIGYEAGNLITTGSQNIAIGTQALSKK